MDARLLKIQSEIPAELASSLRSAAELEDRQSAQKNGGHGWPTGLYELDQHTAWNGLPKAALSLFVGPLGLGATSLWINAASHTVQEGRWVGWVSSEAQLFPLPLQQRQIDLGKVVVIENPNEAKQAMWLLQELLSTTLFGLIGCDLVFKPREKDLKHLQVLTRAMKTSVVFFTENTNHFRSPLYSLIVSCQQKGFLIERALHRPVPHFINRSFSHASFTQHSPQRLKTSHTLLGTPAAKRKG